MNEACHFVLVPSRSSSMPLYPSIMLRAKECAPIPYPSVVLNLGLTFESFKELGVHHSLPHKIRLNVFNITKLQIEFGFYYCVFNYGMFMRFWRSIPQDQNLQVQLTCNKVGEYVWSCILKMSTKNL